MSENVDEEFARRLQEAAESVAGLSDDEALAVLHTRIQQAQLHGLALHRLSLAQARGTLALALGDHAEAEVIASLEEMVASIEQAPPIESPLVEALPLAPLSRVSDPDSPEYDPDLAAILGDLLQRHHQNAVSIYGLIAKTTVAGDEPELLADLERLVAYDLDAITELDPR